MVSHQECHAAREGGHTHSWSFQLPTASVDAQQGLTCHQFEVGIELFTLQ